MPSPGDGFGTHQADDHPSIWALVDDELELVSKIVEVVGVPAKLGYLVTGGGWLGCG
ncbi:hypothetical protein [Acrocarpospora sp. B8E8]|uniref:hypothetical protein n=1 Tax=Acrocarpospora sp. B8E8 TaxID=3153572 RepID=UPI00325CBF38